MDFLKSRLRAFVVALLLLFVCCPMAMADDVKIGGISYTLDSEAMTATVARNADASGNVVIPESVEHGGKRYAVKSIGSRAFWDCDGITSMTLPESINSIGEIAFWSCI